MPGSAVAERVINANRRSKICARMPATTPNMDEAELYVIAFCQTRRTSWAKSSVEMYEERSIFLPMVPRSIGVAMICG